MTATPSVGPTRRWTPLEHHAEQWRLWTSKARFRVVPAGRRSGKTEIAKRWVVSRACHLDVQGRKYAFAAPTRDQAKRIYWSDLKSLVPRVWLAEDPRETDLELKLINGTRLCVVGMDRPERIEGEPLHGIILDEYANMKAEAWTENISPALDTPNQRPGWAWFIGVPEGRNHYWELWTDALALREAGQSWDRFHWFSRDIMSPEAIEAARQRMDPRTFRQELEGSFESYAGLAYYTWSDGNIVQGLADTYDADADLIMCFDFNTSPGVAVVCQELGRRPGIEEGQQDSTAVIGEVWISEHSNTPMVCDRLIGDWGYHKGRVLCYGDASGGAKTTVAVAGSDWDIIKRKLKAHFGDRLSMRNRKANPRERARVNAVNSRISTTDGRRRLFVDPIEAPHVVADFERVETAPGGQGEIQKDHGGPLTHVTDALGYYIHDRFPVNEGRLISKKVV